MKSIPFFILTAFFSFSFMDDAWRFKSDGPLENVGSTRTFSDNVVIMNDKITINTDKVIHRIDQEEMKMYGGVEMFTDLETLFCDTMFYWLDRDLIKASGNVFLKRESQGIKSNEMLITMRDSVMEKIEMTRSAYAYNQGSARVKKDGAPKNFVDEMTSTSMTVHFNNNEASSIQMKGMAETKYHAIEDSVLVGKNDVSGDSISIQIKNSDLYRIEVYDNCRGEFIPESSNSSIDSVITYRGGYIDYRVQDRMSFLEGRSYIDYQGTTLESDLIEVDWSTNKLLAFKKNNVFPIISPDGEDPIRGDTLRYNMIEKNGVISHGRSKMNDSYFHGDELYRNDPNLYHIKDSKYTSCDLDEPHFYLWSKKMKIIPNDRVIAKPLWLYIFDVPLVGIPFAVFPNKGGSRHSGWIMPSYGYSRSSGNYLQNLGYYHAPSDYYDLKFLLNFYDKKGINVRSYFRYKKKYSFDGSVTSTISQNLSGTNDISNLFNSYTNNFDLNWNHKQKIDPTQNLNIRYTYLTSNSFYQQNDIGYDLETRLKQKLESSLNYSKNWREYKNSMSVNISESYNLLVQQSPPENLADTAIVKIRNLPRLSFRHMQSPLFGSGDRWYNSTYFGYSSSLNGIQKMKAVAKELYDGTYDWDDDLVSNYNYYIRHAFSLRSPQKAFGWLNINPSINLKEDWIANYRSPDIDESGDFILDDNNRVSYSVKDGFKRRLTMRGSISLQTTLYGLIPFRVGPLNSLRHTITPSIGTSYAPDFSKQFLGFYDWGYFETDASGKSFDLFEGSYVGRTPTTFNQVYSLSIANDFQAKIKKSDNSYSKIKLLSWNLASSYSPTADSLNWSNVASSMRTRVGAFSLSLSMRHSLYKRVQTGSGMVTVNEFSSLPELRNLNAYTSIKLNDKPSTESSSEDGGAWNANMSLRYLIESSLSDYSYNRKLWVGLNLNLNLTKKWRLGYQSRMDITNNTITSHSLNIRRNLHCWEFTFGWTPSGPGEGYRLHIYVKNPDLRDIRVRSTGGRYFGS